MSISQRFNTLLFSAMVLGSHLFTGVTAHVETDFPAANAGQTNR